MKCLITGCNGNLAKELYSIKDKFGIDYILTDRKSMCVSNEDSVGGYKIGHYNEIKDIDAVIHCAAYTNVPGAEIERKSAAETNIFGTKNMSRFCRSGGVSLVYISTDYVYGGTKGNYKETDLTQPINFYAMTKLVGEAYVDKPNDLIIRTSFKPSIWKYNGAFNDIYTSADYIDIIAEKISLLVVNKASGIFNVGTERKTIYELAKRRNKDVLPISRNTVKNVCMPEDASMNIDKYNNFVNKFKQ